MPRVPLAIKQMIISFRYIRPAYGVVGHEREIFTE
jgi:hypothetical protein